MRVMTKGGNVDLAQLSEDTGSVIVSLGWSSPDGNGDADVSVLLLDEDGRVRGDADFYFYNHPTAPDGSVQLLGKAPTDNGSEDRISLELVAMPPQVRRIVVAASRYGGDRFGDLHDLWLRLDDGAGEALLRFAVTDASVETAFIFGELYRRGERWKFRAVGQGYESGLAGLATDFGIEVDDEGDTPAEAMTDVPAPDVPAGSRTEGASHAVSDSARDLGVTIPSPAPLSGTSPATALATAPSVPVPAPAGEPAPVTAATEPPTAPRRRPRTVKRKVTVPRSPVRSLAENEAWRSSCLFPVPHLKTDRDREARATSVLLAVMAQVPELGRRLTAGFGAPAGRMQTFTEVSLPHGDSPRRPDGVIRVERAGKLWTALVETKTNGNALRPEQVQDYVDIATRRGYEAVITLSNDVVLDGRPPVEVKTDGRRRHKVALRHLSWAEVAHQAQMLIRHEGVGNAAHAWLLDELLRYLRHENSGCHGFQNMGPAWVPVRDGIDAETLSEGDPRAVQVVENWERLVRQICLRVGGELGQKVLPVQRVRRSTDPDVRRATLADLLCQEGRLFAELRMDGFGSVLAITADLRTGKLRTSVDVPAPVGGYPLSSAKRLVRSLAEAPADLHVETLLEGRNGPRGTLERLRPEPANLLPPDGSNPTGFRLSLFKGMGAARGNSESGFIRSVDGAVDRFCGSVIAHLPPAEPRRRATSRPVAG
ncbi:TerD family protein [Streptomyces sp. NPDC005438]|uniref:TerD family protein n=1 Tax=Streptomyces sp. NPDC005438 TaxID=3156880 RepID=UPI0033AFF400